MTGSNAISTSCDAVASRRRWCCAPAIGSLLASAGEAVTSRASLQPVVASGDTGQVLCTFAGAGLSMSWGRQALGASSPERLPGGAGFALNVPATKSYKLLN